jgi:hypothetical protein
MAYVIEDDDFRTMKKIVEEMSDSTKPLTYIEQQITALSLLLILETAQKVKKPRDINSQLDISDDVKGLVVEAGAIFAGLLLHLTNEHGGIMMGKTNGVPWFYEDDRAPELCGIIPSFLNVNDKRSIKEQINERYIGGWNKFDGFKLQKTSWTIKYEGDPDMQPVAATALHGEILAIYPHGWAMIVNGETTDYEIARLD